MQGFLLLNKPSGITSFGAVAKCKRLSGEKRIGHTGTLDPMATGVLPVFIGRATALASYLLDAEKTYTATVKLGVLTDTLDITGNVVDTSDVNVTNEQIIDVISAFKGKSRQIPPMFSAIKKDGVRMYKLARKGETTELPKREIEIFDIKLISPLNGNNEFSFSATVSKGTYIRSLARDIGEKLGCLAVLSALCRTSASGFPLDLCVNLDDLTEENIKIYLKDEEFAVKHLKEVDVTAKQAIRFSNGGRLDIDRLKINDYYDGQVFRVKCGNVFLGLGSIDTTENQLLIKCVINGIK